MFLLKWIKNYAFDKLLIIGLMFLLKWIKTIENILE